MRLASIGRAARVDAEDLDVAVVGRQEPRDHAQGRRLSRPVGAEQGIELAGGNREVEPIDRRPAEALGQDRLSTRAGTSASGHLAISALDDEPRVEAGA